MSEKRFVYGVIKGSRQAHIKDCHTCKSAIIDVYDDDFKYFVDKLNEQQATINHLKQDLEEYKENWDDMVELATKTSLRNVELNEEIGQLQKELNDCEKFRYTVFKRMGELKR